MPRIRDADGAARPVVPERLVAPVGEPGLIDIWWRHFLSGPVCGRSTNRARRTSLIVAGF
jgi:hypothetical protein